MAPADSVRGDLRADYGADRFVLTDPEGKTYTVPLVVEETENGISISY